MASLPPTSLPESVANISIHCEECQRDGLMVRGGPRIPFFNWLFGFYACPCGSKNIKPRPPAPVQGNDFDAENLRLLYGQVNQEITRYRDYEWKIVGWHLVLSWGIFLFAINWARKIFSSMSIVLLPDVFAIFLILLGTLLLSAHLLFIHGELTTNRNWREQIRRKLGIYSLGIFKPEWNTYLHKFESGRDTFIIPFLLFMSITGLGLAYILALQHPVPLWTRSLGPLFVFVWSYFVLFFISVLIVLEVRYIFKAIFQQGLGRRGAF